MKGQKIKATKGMADILPDSAEKHKLPPISLWHVLEKNIRDLMYSYVYEEIRFPILEDTALFVRSIGEVTDVVEKEMYTFNDGDDSVTLRPEGTASCVRACIENGLLRNQQLQKLWYFGPMFRHEQPQYGRYRQFYQFGVEVFGLAGPDIDIEQISMLANLWTKLGIDSSTILEVNSLGCIVDREKYKCDLIEYFNKYKDKLDDDSRKRLNKNPLRILDSKNPDLKDLIRNAPELSGYLNDVDKRHFDEFLSGLDKLDIPYRVNPRLIRGLDYYNKTVFEWVTDKLGAQSTICAGGRYDGLSEQLAGPSTPAFGFAMGAERVLLLMQAHNVQLTRNIDGYLICAGDAAVKNSLEMAENIRNLCPWFSLAMNYDGSSFKSQFKKADKSGAKLALIIGDDELANRAVTVKFLREQREQQTVLLTEIQKFLGGYCGNV